MKILHLGHVPLPPDHPDHGRLSVHPGRWVLNHALAQRRHTDLDVEIVTISHKTSRDVVTDVEGVRVHFLRTFHPYRAATGFLLDRWRVARTVRKLNPDVVHAHGTEDAYALAAEWTGRPHVITAQGLMFQILPRLARPHPLLRFVALTERHSLRRARTVIAKSEYVRRGLAEAHPHLDLRVIPNTYQAELDAPLATLSKPRLAYVGSMDERKGVHLIADAMPEIRKAVPDVSLMVVGNADSPAAFEAGQIGRLRESLGDRLVLCGRRPAPELFELLRPCRALLAPSLEEMFGNQLIEGLMCGLHGIVADETALAENVRRFGNGTVVPQRDAGALAAAAIRALRNPPSDADREAARRRIRDVMGPARVAARHKALYEELAGRS